ncbi:putative sulfate transporter 3.3 [Tasmannia lanceolata]|uniref:putative sulfate transporter 3.3 n=1 Tax=Tasmannia lanceolata TaxID=3420 RepID=UPI0040649AD0
MVGTNNKVEDSYAEDLQSHFSNMATTNTDVSEKNSIVSLEIAMEVHKVIPPPPKSTLAKFKTKLKETLFPDDPLRQFKGQTLGRKIILGFQYIFPMLQWAPNYNLKLFKSDIIAGLTIASLAIPQGISYAKLANLPPLLGLYSSFVPPIVYAILGSSRDVAVGPTAIASLLLGSMLTEVVSPNQPLLYLQLSLTATFFAGIFETLLGFLRLGFIIDFLSKPTLIGFMAGSAVIVSLQQLKLLLGIVNFTKKAALVPVMTSVFQRRDEWSWQTILMGFFFLSFLLVARHVSLRKPKLFWVSAIAPLTSVLLSTLFIFAFKGQNHDISIIGSLKGGVNPFSFNMLKFHSSHTTAAIKVGLVAGIVSLTEGIAVGRTFAAMKNYKVDGNKEMIAIGLMNVVGSCSSCYFTTGAFSRSAVNHNAGGKTSFSNIVMALTVMVTLLFLMPLFHYTPNVVLGAIIVSAVIGLIDIPAVYLVWTIDKIDFLICTCAFIGVIFISVPGGLAIAIGISILKVLLQTTRPKTVILGNIPGTDIYRDLHHYKDAIRVPGFLILSIEAPVNFANTNYLVERITRWIEEEEEKEGQGEKGGLEFVVIDLSGVSTIDATGISLLTELKKVTDNRDMEFVLVNPVGEVVEKLVRANQVHKFMCGDHLFLTVGEAIVSLSSKVKDGGLNHV